jgi:nucleotide-binding universal stress UspA family protein
MPRHILIPLDGTRFSESVFDAAVDIGSLSGARFTLAHLQHVGEAEFWPDRSGARGHLQAAAMRLKQRVPNVNTEFVISNQRTAPAIVSLIKEEGIDMVALTTHGRHGLARLAKGSVAASVARGTKTPVLVFRPLDAPAEWRDRSRARSLWSWKGDG